jgi:hypothetical protein
VFVGPSTAVTPRARTCGLKERRIIGAIRDRGGPTSNPEVESISSMGRS